MICSRVKECVECTRHMMHQAEKGKKKRNRAARKRDKEAASMPVSLPGQIAAERVYRIP